MIIMMIYSQEAAPRQQPICLSYTRPHQGHHHHQYNDDDHHDFDDTDNRDYGDADDDKR